MIEMLQYSFMQRALLAGLLVSVCAALLGVSLVLKRYSMIGDGLWAVLMPLFLISWSSFTMVYYAWSVIEKHMMPKEENDVEAVFSDDKAE